MTKKYTRADFEPLSEAEEALLEKGSFWGQLHRPDVGDTSKTIRAPLLRALLLGQIDAASISDRGLDILSAHIVGELDLQGQEISKPVVFRYCIFDKNVSFAASKINGVVFEECEIEGYLSLLLCHNSGMFGIVRTDIGDALRLEGSEIAVIRDDKKSWPEKGKLFLRGAKYGEFQGASPTSARERLEWLSRMPEFHPQPYRQLAKVMREAGQDQDARDVLYEMEWLRARAQKFKTAQTVALLRKGDGENLPEELERYHGKTRRVSVEKLLRVQFFRNVLNRGFDSVIGYGYKIERALKLTLGMIAVLAVLASVGYHTGYMAPNAASPRVQRLA